jgi:hypothetical protein
MRRQQRKTFQQILRDEAPRMARHLEMKARIASKLAKVTSVDSTELYSVKNRAVRELFRLPDHKPFIRDAWGTHRRILLSLKLNRTDSWLHFPFEELNGAMQRFYGLWAARRARRNLWQPAPRIHPRVIAAGGARLSRTAR